MNSPLRVRWEIIAGLGCGLTFSLAALYLARPMILGAAHYFGMEKMLWVWFAVLAAFEIAVIVAARRAIVGFKEGVFGGIIASLLIFTIASRW